MTLAENLGERGDQPPPPPPVRSQDQPGPQISGELRKQYPDTQSAETDGAAAGAATSDASSRGWEKAMHLFAAGLVAFTFHADETPPQPNEAKQEYVALARQEYVAPAKDNVSLKDVAVTILDDAGKVAAAIGEDAKGKADALDDAARLAADRNENAPEIEFRREDLDRSQDEGK